MNRVDIVLDPPAVLVTGKSTRIQSPPTSPSQQLIRQELINESNHHSASPKPSVLDQYRHLRSKRSDSTRAVHRSRGIKLYSSQYLKVTEHLKQQQLQQLQRPGEKLIGRRDGDNGEDQSFDESHSEPSKSISWLNQQGMEDHNERYNPHVNPFLVNGGSISQSMMTDYRSLSNNQAMMMKFEDMKTLRRYRTWSGNNTFYCGGTVMVGSHPYQLLLSIFLITSTYIAWIALVLPFFNEIWFYFGVIMLFTVNIVTLISTAATDPGIYPRRKPLIVPNPSSSKCTQEVDDVSAPMSNAAHDSKFFKMILFAMGFDFFRCFNGAPKARRNGHSLYGAISSSSLGSPISSPGKPSNKKSNSIEHSHSNDLQDESSASVESFFALNHYVPSNMIRDEYCSICHVIHSKRTRHCKFCNNCVETFDHHCPVSSCLHAWFLILLHSYGISFFSGQVTVLAIVTILNTLSSLFLFWWRRY
jgi:hypothetical protein